MIQHFKVTVICLGIVLFIGTGTAFTLSKKVQDDPVVISTCDTSDFDEGSCNLTCTVPNTDGASTLDSCSWKYYSDDKAVAVTLYDGITVDTTTDFVISLTLSTYNPGWYECELDITDQNSVQTQYTAATTITDAISPGVNLNGDCTESTDCYALNSVCDSTCQCAGDYDITFTSDDDTPACLAHQSEGDNCNIDEECAAENEDFQCVNTVCTCEGIPTPIAEENGDIMCIDSAYLTDPCVYNEQCGLFDSNSLCNVGFCDCAAGYYINKVDEADVTTYVCAVDTTTEPPPTTDTTTEPPPTTDTSTETAQTETTTAGTGTTSVNTGTTAANTGTGSVPTVPSTAEYNSTFVPNTEPMSGGAITGIVFASLIGCGLVGAIGYTAFNIIQSRR